MEPDVSEQRRCAVVARELARLLAKSAMFEEVEEPLPDNHGGGQFLHVTKGLNTYRIYVEEYC